ncbi:MAG: CBS domain-containing protein [Ferruginibacter sp.]
MGSISSILKSKGTVLHATTPGTLVYNALELMVEKNISSVLVMEDEKLLGIFTERDYARKVTLKGRFSKDTRIDEVMTADLVTISPDATIDECMRLMTDRHIRHLPVVENEEVLGLISIGDVVKFIIEDQKTIIKQMEQYITGI